MQQKYLDPSQIRSKIQNYCAYQERCHAEVRTKLLQLGCYGEDLEEMLGELILDGYLSEERYAHSFTRGKFRIKGWGKMRIRYALKGKKIHSRLIEKAIAEEIDPDEYLKTAFETANKKLKELKSEKNMFVRKKKLRDLMVRKGFEWEVIGQIESDLGL